MSYITKIIETLGGWKQAWSLVKPSTSTTVMAIVLFVLVIFFPEHQWQSQEDKDEASHPLFTQTQQVEETETSSTPQETTTTQVEDDTNNEETDDTSVQNTSPASEAENDDSYNDQGSNESYAPQPSQQESVHNTPDGTQGAEDDTAGEHGDYNNRQYSPSQDQEPAPEEDTPAQNYNGEENTNQQ